MARLPPNASAAVRAFADAVSEELASMPVSIRETWDPARCPVAYLPWLAWARSVDEWDASWTEETKRRVLSVAGKVHRHKGTVGAIQDLLSAAGYPDAVIIDEPAFRHDGVFLYDGTRTYESDPSHWARYSVTLPRAITIRQAEQVRRLLDIVAPARCVLTSLNFTEATHLYDGSIEHDGSYSYGEA